MKNATRLLVISLALMLSGCAYSPKQVEASRPLVNQTASTDLQAMAASPLALICFYSLKYETITARN